MKQNQSILTVENFKFSIFDSVPKPNADTAYILYREGGTADNILLITSQHPVLSNQIRTGRFNKKVTMSLAWRELKITKEIADASKHYKFIIDIGLTYRIKDALYVYQKNLTNIDFVVSDKIYKIIELFQKKYDFESQMELESELRRQTVEQLGLMNYLEIAEISIEVDVDERAQKVIDSNLDTIANNVLMQNQKDIASLEVEQEKCIQIQKLEAEKEIVEKKSAIDIAKIKGVNAAKEEAGEDIGIFLAYVKGEISSVEFDERVRNSKNADMMSKINALGQLVNMDVLSGPALEKAAMKLLGEAEIEVEQIAIVQNAEDKNEIVIEDAEEY